MTLLVIFGSFAAVMITAFCTWGAAQAGAGREFARIGQDDGRDVAEVLWAQRMNDTDAFLAVRA